MSGDRQRERAEEVVGRRARHATRFALLPERPFISQLVEYVARPMASLKWGPGRCKKHVLIAAAGDVLSETVIQRKKRGFELPFDRWLRAELRDEAQNGLRELDRRGVLPPRFAVGQWNRFDEGRQHWSRIWQLYVFGRHLARQVFAPAAASAIA